MPTNKKLDNTIYVALFCLAAFTFTSISLTALFHILILIPGIYLAIKSYQNSKFEKLSKSSILLLTVIIWSALSVFANWEIIQNPMHNLKKLKYLIIGLISVPTFRYFFSLANEEVSQKRIKILLNTFIIATTLASLSGLIALMSGFNPLKFKTACHATRACGMYGMYMTYGYGIALVLTILSGFVLKRQLIQKILSIKILIPCFLINLIGFALSYARGAYIGYFCSIPFFFFKKNKKRFFTIVLSLTFIGGLSFAFIPQIKEMLTSRGRIESIMIRVSQYQAAIHAAKESPIFGLGYKNFEINSRGLKEKYDLDFKHFQGHGHSNFFEHLASTGFIGLILLTLFHLAWLVETYNRDDFIGFIGFPFVINFTLSGQFQYTFGDGENLFLIMAMYALTQISYDSPNK